VAVTLAAGLLSAPRMALAYGERRYAELPCREAVESLRAEAPGSPNRTLAMTQIEIWRALYPWLRTEYSLRVVDGYSSTDRPADVVISERLNEFAGTREFWWISATGEGSPWPAPTPDPTALPYFSSEGVEVLETRQMGACRLDRVVQLEPDAQVATAAVQGGPIRLLRWESGDARAGSALPLVLYWTADEAVTAGYTVFTQLFDGDGTMVAQQDNLPVRGLAPTETWAPGAIIRDPYLLPLPDRPGDYRLLLGLYGADGTRAPLRLPDGSEVDALEQRFTVPAPPAESAAT
jgi:hypothetical protein